MFLKDHPGLLTLFKQNQENPGDSIHFSSSHLKNSITILSHDFLDTYGTRGVLEVPK
jgi:hypothetical protein